MKNKYLLFMVAMAVFFAGCSEKKEAPNDLNKRSEIKEKILEDRSNVVEPMPRGPKYQTKGCLRGCGGLPCDEKVRCVMRNCPNVRIECVDGEVEVLEDKEKSFNVKPHKKILCQRGCDDIPKNSVEYKNCVLRNCPSAKFVR